MDLSEEQISLLKERAAEGAQLNDLQKIIQNEFEKSITYMETRFLISDLGIEIKTEEEPAKEEEETVVDNTPEPAEAEGGVSVSVDQVTRPGMMANGAVQWSDGVTASWYVDQMGRLGLESADDTYQPSPEDAQEFQMKLQQLLGGA